MKQVPVEVEEDKYQKLMRELDETRKRAAMTLEKGAILRDEIKVTIENSQRVDQAFEKFKSDFNQVMNDLVRGMADKMTTDGVDESKITHKPIIVKKATEAAKYMNGCKQIMVLTGAGLSAASGIPTFRGAKGFWT